MSDFLSQKQTEIQERIAELQPLVAEYERLQRALEALDGVDHRRSRGTSSRGGRPAGRPRGSGQRAHQALELIRREPGLGAAEIARKIGVHPNYSYRILPGLEEQGVIEKRGKSWFPVGA